MIVWSTQFPVLPNRSVDDLLKLCEKWLTGSPHAAWQADQIPARKDFGIASAKLGESSVEIATARNEAGDEFAGFRHHWIDKERREWTTEICGWRTPQRFIVGVHLHCFAADTGIPLPRAKKPYIVRQLVEELGGDVDGMFQVSAEPRLLEESDVDLASRLIRGESEHFLPIIYVSSTWKNVPAFDAKRLAEWSSGMAHVVVEPSRRFSFILAARVERTNPYEGAAAILWPHGSGRSTVLRPFDYQNGTQFASAVANEVQKALSRRRPDHRCTWEFLRELIVRRRLAVLREEGKASLEEYIKEFDEEVGLLRKRLEDANREIARFRSELIGRSRIDQLQSDGLLAPSSERELFAGEQRDILVRALLAARNTSQPDGRVKDVLSALLAANRATGESERIENGIRDALMSCTNAGRRELRALEELGFTISEDGKHYKLVFRGDDRYTFAMAKTGSDHRGMKNWVSDTTKRLFR